MCRIFNWIGQRGRRVHLSGVVLSSLSLFFAVGCAEKDRRDSIVTGSVTLDKKPIVDGSVLFISEDGQAASAQLGGDGKYLLRCVAGKYNVAVASPPEPDPIAGAVSQQEQSGLVKIPRRYNDVGTSRIVVEVVKGDNLFDVDLDSKAK